MNAHETKKNGILHTGDQSSDAYHRMADESIYSEIPEINRRIAEKLPVLGILGFKTEEITPIPYGSRLIFRSGDKPFGVNIYYSKKKGYSAVADASSPSPAARQIRNTLLSVNPGELISPEPAEQGFDCWIGSDEAGKGDYFGSLVVAAFRARREIAPNLRDLGIRDSKSITNAACLSLSAQIHRLFKNDLAVIELVPETYNRLYAEFVQQKKTLNDMLYWAHQKALLQLSSRNVEAAVIDQFARNLHFPKLRDTTMKVIIRPGGESNLAVAAASVLARARYLDRLSQFSREMDVGLKPGAGEDVDRIARELVRRHGQDILRRTSKLHFKNTQKVISNAVSG